MHSATAIVVAAGKGTRLGVPEKVLLPLAGRPLITYCIDAFEGAETVSEVIVVAGEHTRARIEQLVADSSWNKVRRVVQGGERRQDSVAAGLAAVPSGSDIVVVHDGARPNVTADLINACVHAAIRYDAAIAAIPVTDTLKKVEDGRVTQTIPRAGLWAAQTPQAARTDLLRSAIAHAGHTEMTDEASMLEAIGVRVAIVPGSLRNVKITTADDLELAQALLTWPSPRTNP